MRSGDDSAEKIIRRYCIESSGQEEEEGGAGSIEYYEDRAS